MIIGIPKETHPGEQRVAFIPSSVDRLVKKGAQIIIETGLGTSIGISDEDYMKAGATIENNRQLLLSSADIVLRLRKPPIEEISLLKKGSIHISFLDPFNEKELVNAIATPDQRDRKTSC